MRKRMAALLLAAALLLSLSGCGVFDTKLARAVQKMSKLDSLRLELQAEAVLAVEGPAEQDGGQAALQLPASCSGVFDLKVKPLLVKGETALQYPGGGQKHLACIEQKDGAYYLYSRANAGSLWQKRGLAQWDKLQVSGLRYIVQGAETFSEVGREEIKGSPATRYDGLLAGEYLEGLLQLYGVEELLRDGLGFQLAEGLFSGMKDIPASLWLDESSGMVVRLQLDLRDCAADLAARQLRQSRDASGFDALGLSLSLESLLVTVDLGQFDAIEDISIPDEARAAWGEDTKQPWE